MPKLDLDVEKLVDDINYLLNTYDLLEYLDDDVRLQDILKRVRRLEEYKNR